MAILAKLAEVLGLAKTVDAEGTQLSRRERQAIRRAAAAGMRRAFLSRLKLP